MVMIGDVHKHCKLTYIESNVRHIAGKKEVMTDKTISGFSIGESISKCVI